MYEVWDRESGNRLGEFETETQALERVRELAVLLSEDDRRWLALGLIGPTGPVLVAQGAELVALANREHRGAVIEFAATASRRMRRVWSSPLGFLRLLLPIDTTPTTE
jgi:hypothetical protein